MKKNYTNSDIFNSYIQIAEKKGLVSLAEDEGSESAKKVLEKNPRADSLTKERISKLYNVKPDTLKGMQYDRNIIERAHPKPVVVAPSYDKLNGLVENNNERQDIMLRIVNKRTNGLLTQHKYAREEMARTLVRIANDMDNRNEEELRSLADECLEGFTKEADFSSFIENIFKGEDLPSWSRPMVSALRIDAPAAAVGALIGALFGTAAGPAGTVVGAGEGALLGVHAGFVLGPIISLIAGTAPMVKNISDNSNYVIKAATDMEEALPRSELIKEIKQKTIELKPLAEKYQQQASDMERLLKKKVSEGELNPHIEVIDDLNKKIEEVKDIYNKYIDDYRVISNDYFKAKNIGDVGRSFRHWFAPLSSSLEPPLALKDAIKSLQEAIEDYQNTIKEARGGVIGQAAQKADQIGKKIKSKIDSDKEPSDTSVEDDFSITASQARCLVNFIKNS